MADPKVTAPAPQRLPRKGGLTSVIDFQPSDRLGASAGVQWDGNICTTVQPTVGLCWGVAGTPDKEGEGFVIGTSIGTPIVGYFGVECFLDSGTGEANYDERAREGLALGESYFLEAAIYEAVLDSATIVGSGTDLVDALALAENYIDQEYAGLPLVWTSRADATRLGSDVAVIPTGDANGALQTIQGTPVIASGYFTDDDFTGVWVSGRITVWAGPVTVTRSVDPTTNRTLSIAERVYAFGFDCVAPVRVDIDTTP